MISGFVYGLVLGSKSISHFFSSYFITTTFFFGIAGARNIIVPNLNVENSINSQKSLLFGYHFGVIQLPTLSSSAFSPATPSALIQPWAGDSPDNIGKDRCRSSTSETFLDCPCTLIGMFLVNPVVILVAPFVFTETWNDISPQTHVLFPQVGLADQQTPTVPKTPMETGSAPVLMEHSFR